MLYGDWLPIAELKGAVAGGLVAALLDSGTFLKRSVNGVGAVAIAVVMAPGTAELATKFIGTSGNLTTIIAAIWALIGLIVAEALQRIFRRVMNRSDEIADRFIDIDKEKKDK